MPGRTGPARRAWIGLVQNPKSAYLLAPSFRNGFDGGTNTTVISTGNSGGASGDAWSTVTGSPTYSSTHPLHGPLTSQFALATSTVTSLTTTKTGTTTEHWIRFYVYFTANPAAITTLYTALSTATAAVTVKLDTAGKLLVAPTSGTTDYTFTNAITLNAWNRVEIHIINSTGTGTVQTRLYAADSQTVVEDSGVRSTTSTLTNTTSHVFGQQAAVAGTTSTFWLGDPAVGTTGFLGPNIAIPPPIVPTRTAPSGPTLRGTFTPAATAAITTASFTPTAGALLIATTYGDAVAGVSNSATIVDSLGNFWNPAYLRNFGADGRNAYLQAWYQVVEASPAARTVTITDADGTQNHGGWVEEWTSVDTTVVPFGVTEYRGSNTADPLTVVLTTAYPNSQVIGAGVNWDTSAWVAGAATTVTQTSQVAASAGGASLKATSTTPTAGTTVTLTASRAGTVADFHLVAFELLGALTAPPVTVPPTVVIYKDAYATYTTTRALTSRTVATGDVVAVIVSTEDHTTSTASSLALTSGTATIGTVTKQQDAGGTSHAGLVLFTFTVTGGGTMVLTVTYSATGSGTRFTTAETHVATGSNGIGVTGKTLTSTTTITTSLTTSAHSYVGVSAADWAAKGGATTTLTPAAGVLDLHEVDGVVDQVADGVKYASRAGHWTDSGVAGTTAYGVTVPTSVSYNQVAFELLGAASGGATPEPPTLISQYTGFF